MRSLYDVLAARIGSLHCLHDVVAFVILEVFLFDVLTCGVLSDIPI